VVLPSPLSDRFEKRKGTSTQLQLSRNLLKVPGGFAPLRAEILQEHTSLDLDQFRHEEGRIQKRPFNAAKAMKEVCAIPFVGRPVVFAMMLSHQCQWASRIRALDHLDFHSRRQTVTFRRPTEVDPWGTAAWDTFSVPLGLLRAFWNSSVPRSRPFRNKMASYGYARVSTLDQDLTIQRAALKAAGCTVVRAEKASGSRRDGRTELQVLLDFVQPGDTLVV
jgi:hypothetical protein